MTHFPRVLIAPDGRWPTDGGELVTQLAGQGCLMVTDATQADVMLTFDDQPWPQDLPADAGVVVVVTGDPRSTTSESWLSSAGITGSSGVRGQGLVPASAPMTAAALSPSAGLGSTPTMNDLLARVDTEQLQSACTLALLPPAVAFLRMPATGRTPGPAVGATCIIGARRIAAIGVVLNDASATLLTNAVFHVARVHTDRALRGRHPATESPAWLRLKSAVTELRPLQAKDGSVTGEAGRATALVTTITECITDLAPLFPHDDDYLAALVKDFTRWADGGLEVPDFLDSLAAFHPEIERVDGREHLVVFPMYTQNGNPDRNVEAVLFQVIWPDFVADLEAGDYSNKLFVPIRFLDFTAGYETNSAVLFPETVAMREVPRFTWGAIFADREAARFRAVVSAAAEITGLALPPQAARLMADQGLAEQTFVMWDLIHDRTHMHGDLPFDPFMIKQRMPYFLYTLEELRCDLTAFRESVELERKGIPHARLVQYAILFDRIFRFPISGTRTRNYDGLGGQLLFAWLHQHHVLHWTDNRLTIDWSEVTEPVLDLGRQIEDLYWRSIDRPKIAHWLAAYELVSHTVTPHPGSVWAQGAQALPLDGPPKGLTDAVLPDEFPLSMFYEALGRKLSSVVAATAGITG